jgi:hypothetical protein
MKTETYIVIGSDRRALERIENTLFNLGKLRRCPTRTAVMLAKEISLEVAADIIEIYPITDFMDMWNDGELDAMLKDNFLTYVRVVVPKKKKEPKLAYIACGEELCEAVVDSNWNKCASIIIRGDGTVLMYDYKKDNIGTLLANLEGYFDSLVLADGDFEKINQLL